MRLNIDFGTVRNHLPFWYYLYMLKHSGSVGSKEKTPRGVTSGTITRFLQGRMNREFPQCKKLQQTASSSFSNDTRKDPINQVWTYLIEDIRHIARMHIFKEHKNFTLDPTDLIHEVYIRFEASDKQNWNNRDEFLSSISMFMKFILTDYARAKKRLCRGGDRKAVPLAVVAGELAHYDVASSSEGQEAMHALETLRKHSPLASDVAYHRFVLGLTVPITAEALHVSQRTVKSKWAYAKAWLREKLSDEHLAR